MNVKLGQILRDERSKRKMSQNDFAHFLDLERSTYESIENNRLKDLKMDTVIKLVDKLYLNLNLFFPEEILEAYFNKHYLKRNVDLKSIIHTEVLKVYGRVERKFKRNPNKDKDS